MKSFCLRMAVLALFAMLASGASAFLRVGNKVGDYWVFRFAGHKVNVTFDVDHKQQKSSDREVDVSNVDLTFGGVSVSQAVIRPEGGNLAKITLRCKTAGCVYSHFDSNTYNSLDILCEQAQDCITFVQALQLP